MQLIYELSWLQADDDRADHQQVHVSTNSTGSFVDVSGNLAMTSNTHQVTITENDVVHFFVRTFNGDESKQSDSVTYTFTAVDPTPLAPATTLNAVFVQRV